MTLKLKSILVELQNQVLELDNTLNEILVFTITLELWEVLDTKIKNYSRVSVLSTAKRNYNFTLSAKG